MTYIIQWMILSPILHGMILDVDPWVHEDEFEVRVWLKEVVV